MTTSTASRVPSSLAGAPVRNAGEFARIACGDSCYHPGLDRVWSLGAKLFRIVQPIAGGVSWGPVERDGLVGALGLVFLFTIASMAAAVYYLARRVVRLMVEHGVPCERPAANLGREGSPKGRNAVELRSGLA